MHFFGKSSSKDRMVAIVDSAIKAVKQRATGAVRLAALNDAVTAILCGPVVSDAMAGERPEQFDRLKLFLEIACAHFETHWSKIEIDKSCHTLSHVLNRLRCDAKFLSLQDSSYGHKSCRVYGDLKGSDFMVVVSRNRNCNILNFGDAHGDEDTQDKYILKALSDDDTILRGVGDLIDRGAYGLRVLVKYMILMLAGRAIVARGNHEDSSCSAGTRKYTTSYKYVCLFDDISALWLREHQDEFKKNMAEETLYGAGFKGSYVSTAAEVCAENVSNHPDITYMFGLLHRIMPLAIYTVSSDFINGEDPTDSHVCVHALLGAASIYEMLTKESTKLACLWGRNGFFEGCLPAPSECMQTRAPFRNAVSAAVFACYQGVSSVSLGHTPDDSNNDYFGSVVVDFGELKIEVNCDNGFNSKSLTSGYYQSSYDIPDTYDVGMWTTFREDRLVEKYRISGEGQAALSKRVLVPYTVRICMDHEKMRTIRSLNPHMAMAAAPAGGPAVGAGRPRSYAMREDPDYERLYKEYIGYGHLAALRTKMAIEFTNRDYSVNVPSAPAYQSAAAAGAAAYVPPVDTSPNSATYSDWARGNFGSALPSEYSNRDISEKIYYLFCKMCSLDPMSSSWGQFQLMILTYLRNHDRTHGIPILEYMKRKEKMTSSDIDRMEMLATIEGMVRIRW